MKKIFIILTLMLAVALPVSAQVFMMEDEMSLRSSESAEDPFVLHSGGLEYDQTNYVPAGSGIALLVTFGGLYLMKKEKKSIK